MTRNYSSGCLGREVPWGGAGKEPPRRAALAGSGAVSRPAWRPPSPVPLSVAGAISDAHRAAAVVQGYDRWMGRIGIFGWVLVGLLVMFSGCTIYDRAVNACQRVGDIEGCVQQRVTQECTEEYQTPDEQQACVNQQLELAHQRMAASAVVVAPTPRSGWLIPPPQQPTRCYAMGGGFECF